MTEPAPVNPTTKSLQPWLHAWTDPIANLNALSSNVTLDDVTGDGEYKLLIADFNQSTNQSKLKVFSNTNLSSEHTLIDRPTAMTSFYPDQTSINQSSSQSKCLPSLAIAANSNIYIYRSLRPYYKFTLPVIETDPIESNIWKSIVDGGSIEGAIQSLLDAKENGIPLSVRSAKAIELTTLEEQTYFLKSQSIIPYQQLTVATCLSTLNKNSSGGSSGGGSSSPGVSHLVVGTEANEILLLEANGTACMKKFSLPPQATPQIMLCEGLLDIEYRIFIACRNAQIYVIKKHKLLGQVIECEAAIVSMAVIEKTLFVACCDHTVTAYNFKFNKLYTLQLPSAICNLDVLVLRKIKNTKLLLIALNEGKVLIYHGKNALSELNLNERLTAMKFGPYGREEACLILLTASGKLSIRILQRSAHFDDSPENGQVQSYIEEQDIPLALPKKSAMSLEQTQREREYAVDLHRIFQRDLCKLRLNTAQAYVKVIQGGFGTMSNIQSMQCKLDASVTGLGPIFKIKIGIRNLAANKLLNDLICLIQYDSTKYMMSEAAFRIPLLVPSAEYVQLAEVRSVDPTGQADSIKIFLLNPKSVIPAITAIINMPFAEVDPL